MTILISILIIISFPAIIIIVIVIGARTKPFISKSVRECISSEIDGEIIGITRCSMMEHMMYSGSLRTSVIFYKVSYKADDNEYVAIFKGYPLVAPTLFKDKI